MKKLIALVLGITLAYSCSTNSDGNGNSTTTVVPVAPSNLTGVVASSTQINLSWTDNSTNETGFKVERKTGTGTYAAIGTTATDVSTFNDTGLTPSTTYTYRVYSFNAVGNSLTYSNEVTVTTTSLPTITTTAISGISTTAATTGGTITSDGGSTVTARGVCWSTSPNPTIALATKTNNGSGTGTFPSNINGLMINTTYYLRAYATNSLGTAYGNEISFTTVNALTDIDGNNYQLITICNQTWTKSNLNVSHYRNGDIIPQVTDATQWNGLTTGAWCYYANMSSNGIISGKLYNWYAVNDPRGLAPAGYHIPTNAEWTSLTTCLGGETIAGGKMKETGTSHWTSPNQDATNSSGFTAIPGGNCGTDGTFHSFTASGLMWSSSAIGSGNSYYRRLNYYDGSVNNLIGSNIYGFSVRCLKD